MIHNYLPLKQTIRVVFVSLLFVVVGLTHALAQTYSYSYSPSKGSYTNCSTGSYSAKKIKTNCTLYSSTTVSYSKGVVCATLQNHYSSGNMRFLVQKCDGGNFAYHNSGKLFIVQSTSDVVYCEDYYISNYSTDELEAYFSYNHFSGTRYFHVYMSGTTEDGYSYNYYAGQIKVVGSVSSQPPTTPSNPSPSNYATGVSLNPTLSWSCNGQGSAISYYEVYVHNSDESYSECFYPSQSSYTIPSSKTLSYNETYYWRIRAYDNNGLSTWGPLWEFTTKSNQPPTTPSNPSPSNGATGVSTSPTLSWSCSDPEGGSVGYTVWWGTSSSSMSNHFGGSGTSASFPNLSNNQTYYWKVVAYDQQDNSSTGPVWHFTTKSILPPTTPSNPSPSNYATGVSLNPTLSWSCNGQGSAISYYEVYVHNSDESYSECFYPSQSSYTIPSSKTLSYNKTYYWRIRAFDNNGLSTWGPLWEFTTKSNQPPTTPSNPSPSNGATGVSTSPTLSWSCSDPEGGGVGYTVWWGTSSSSMSNHFGGSGTSASFPNLSNNQTYYWKVVAYDQQDNSSTGPVWHFTTEVGVQPPTISNPSPSNYATNVSVYPHLSWSCSPNGTSISNYEVYVHNSDESYSECFYVNQTSCDIIEPLNYNQMFYWRVVAIDTQGGRTNGPLWRFTTKVGDSPWAVTYDDSVNGTSVTLIGKVNPRNLQTTYYFDCGTTTSYGNTWGQGVLPASEETSTVYTTITGLSPNTYHYRVRATNSAGTEYGVDKTFVIENQDCFGDCASNSCGDNGNQMYVAAQYLCDLGIVQGINGNLEPDVPITRAQLAKVALFGLYNGPSHVPNPLVTDYFPSIYPDLQDKNTYYYQAAKALLYLEYGDGISPFDRDRSCFDPSGSIERIFVLKVLLETFNIPPATWDGYNPFGETGTNAFPHSNPFWGYARKAYDLNIIQATLDPYNDCTRGQAFLMLYRIMKGIADNTIPAPNPQNTESPATSSFFIPANLSPAVVNAIRGIEYGNFNYYEKDFFNIPGYMNLGFGVAYNSYLMEMPDDFYPVKPMGKAWTHTYDMYMNVITDSYNNASFYVFHLQNGALLIYKSNLESLTQGNYYDLTCVNSNKYTLKSRDQLLYTFQRNSSSETIFTLREIKDRNGNVITLSYNGQRIQTVTTMGRTLNFEYKSGTDLLAKVTDPMGRTVRFSYDSDNQLVWLKDAKNQTTYFNYGTLDIDKGLLKEIQLPEGNYVYNNYEQRKLKSMTRVANNDDHIHTTVSIQNQYQSGNYQSIVTTTKGNAPSVTTTYQMNDQGRVTNINDGFHTDVSFEYGLADNPDLVSKMTDGKTNIQTTYAYSSKGLPTSMTITDGTTTIQRRTVYNSFNDIKEYYDANNNKTTYTYNSQGNMTRITDALGNQTNIVNNSHGVPTRVTNPMGVYVDYGYNEYGNIESISIPALGQSTSIYYDEVSRMESQTDFTGKTVSYTYDNNDNVTSITDPMGNTTSYIYDANDNVKRIINALGAQTNLNYDDNDFLTSVTFGDYTRSYTYNRDGSLKTFTDPNGHTFEYSYNTSGELTGDGTTMLTYLNNGRLWKVTKDGKPITYEYDAFGRTSSITYDGKTVSYTYDPNGNVKTIIYPGNKTVSYNYDALNRMTTVTDWNNATTSYYYRADGQLDYFQYPNQVRTTYSYDNASRCNGFSTKRNSGNGAVIAEYSFEFDAMGNHSSETITEPYESYPSISTSNITYNHDLTNHLNTAGDLTFTYDNNGNTVTRSGRTYNYDYFNNLTSVSGDFTATYTYDGLGNRRSATRNGLATKYVLSLLASSPSILMETDGNGNAQDYYIYGANGLVSRIDSNNNTRYYVYDFRGSTVAMIDATTSANITHKYQYDDFGKVLQSEEADLNRFRYVGKYGVMYEDEVLTFMRARYYDPEIGRFLSEDPIWNSNLYPYAENNPITGIDPNGEFVLTATFCIVTGALTMIGAGLSIYGIVDRMIKNNGQGMPDLINDKGEVDVWECVDFANTYFMPAIGAIGGIAKTGFQAFTSIFTSVVSDATSVATTVHSHIENKKQKTAQAAQAAQLDPKSVKDTDPDALYWMLTSTDPHARSLKDHWYSVTKIDNWSDKKKYEVRVQLIKIARTYMK